MNNLLVANNVSKSFGSFKALNNVSLEVPKGSVFGLLGPNGAGKTTLIRIINQITMPDSGSILLDGKPLHPNDIKNIGYLPEERGLYKSMKVGEQVMYLAQLKGLSKTEAKERLNYWFDRLGIDDWWNKKIQELSKGMAQKVQFICAVLHEPKLLILDEPFSGFDPINVELIKQELIEMRAAGKTVILSTHNMKSVEEICDRAALINESKKIAEGSISELQAEFKSGLYSIRFRGSMIAFVNALWTGFELVDKEILGDDKFVATVKMRRDNSFQDLLKVLIGQIEIEAAWEVLPSMQDVFIRKVSGDNSDLN